MIRINKKVIAVALLSSVFISLVYGLPTILIRKNLLSRGLPYLPLTLFSAGDEAAIYAPFINEAAKNGLWLSDPALQEHGQDPTLMTPSGPLLWGSLAKILGLKSLLGAVDFIFPPIIFLLFFFTIFVLTKSVFTSLAISIIFIFSREIASLVPFSTIHQLKSFLAYFKPWPSALVESNLSFDRFFSPEWTFIPLALFFLLWILALQKKNFWLSLASGASYGILFYSYPYDWMTVSVILGVLAMVTLLSRDYKSFKMSLIAGVTGLLISLPYWINLGHLKALPYYNELLNRTGLEIGRVFRWFLWPHYVLWLGLAAWLMTKKNKNILALLALSVFLASFILLNIQLLSGYVPQPDRFLKYSFTLPLILAYLIVVLLLLSDYKEFFLQRRKYFLAAALFLLALVVIRNIRLQVAYAKQNSWRYTLDQPIYDSLNWMNSHLEKDAVVMSPLVFTNAHLLIYTPAKVFFPPNGIITAASDEENLERFIIAAKLFGASDKKIQELLSYDFLVNRPKSGGVAGIEERVLGHLYHLGLVEPKPDTYFRGGELSLRHFPEVEKMATATLYQWRESRTALVKKYHFDYVYVGPYEKKLFSFAKEKFPLCIDDVYENEGVEIYKVCPTYLPPKKNLKLL